MKDLLDITALVLIYFFVFYRKWHKQGRDQLLLNTTLYIYLSFVLYFTMMPVIASLPFIFNHSYVPMNLEPFIDIIANHGDSTRQIFLNVIMTIPFGFLFPLTNKHNSTILRTILAAFLLSLAIEIIQPLLSSARSSDITDIITNVLGGVIGYAFYLIFRPLTTKILNYLASSSPPEDPNAPPPTDNQ